jgi:2-polyprenyl-3-methyl-5-hydroxy-6-metoxy-1,4-benzoquinol methylase
MHRIESRLRLSEQVSDLWVRRMLVYGDPMVLDRWRWIASRLPTRKCSVLDAGSGNGSIATNMGRLGHSVVALNFSESELQRCQRRNPFPNVTFELQDLRSLGEREDLRNRFDIVICSEVIEHVLNDSKLMCDLAKTLKPGGQLLLTTPNLNYRPLDGKLEPPYELIEDGRHVRKGYDDPQLRRLSQTADLDVTDIQYCSGDWSQRLTRWYRALHGSMDPRVASILITPLRFLPFLRDRARWPPFSICMEASRSER